MNTYEEPRSLAEAIALKEKLTGNLARIQLQLTERKAEIAGRRLSSEEWSAYQEWRASAVGAVKSVQGKLRRVKESMRTWHALEASQRACVPLSDDPTDLLRAIRRLFLRLKEDGVDFEDDEWALLDMVNNHIQNADRGRTGSTTLPAEGTSAR